MEGVCQLLRMQAMVLQAMPISKSHSLVDAQLCSQRDVSQAGCACASGGPTMTSLLQVLSATVLLLAGDPLQSCDEYS